VLLHRVEVKNFRRHESFALDLCDAAGHPRPLTVLVGPNMSGKTTLLDAAHLAYEAVRNLQNPTWRPEFDPSDPTLRPNPNEPIQVTIQWSLHDGEWDAMATLEGAMQGKLLVAKAPLYSFHLRWSGPDEEPLSRVSDANPRNAQLAFRGRALAALALRRRVASEDVLDRVGGLLYLEQNRRGTIGSADDRLDFARDALPGLPMSDVIGWLARASIQHAKWDESTRGESQWSRAKRIFHNLAAPAEIDDAVPYEGGYDLRLRCGDQVYYASGTSSGERQILRFAANLAFFRAQRSVVMIDELELNLHPRWQRSLLRFCETGGDDDNQFIVTTHSDVVLRYADPGSVISLGKSDGGWA
jgi:AAA domain, putative AbiEii toxin, Type IV TA system/AAA ATPase domain